MNEAVRQSRRWFPAFALAALASVTAARENNSPSDFRYARDDDGWLDLQSLLVASDGTRSLGNHRARFNDARDRGSKIVFFDPVAGDNDSAGVYWWDRQRIVDAAGRAANPENGEVYYIIAQYYVSQDEPDTEKVMEALRSGVKKDFEDESVKGKMYALLSLMLDEEKEYTEARDMMLKALEIDPAHPEYLGTYPLVYADYKIEELQNKDKEESEEKE